MSDRPLAAAEPDRRECPSNRRSIGQVRSRLEDAIVQAMTPGFFGEVRLCISFQDGVIQRVTVERSQTLR